MTENFNRRNLIMLPTYKAELIKNFEKRENCYQIQTSQIVMDPFGDFAKATYQLGLEEEKNKRKNYLEFIKNSESYFNEKIKELSDLVERHSKDKSKLIRDVLKKEEFNLKELKKLKKLFYDLPYIKSNEKLYELSTESLFIVSSTIAYTISDSLYADFSANEIIDKLKNLKIDDDSKVVKLIDFANGGTYNPLLGNEYIVIREFEENFLDSVKINNDYLTNLNKLVLSNAIKVIKRTYGNNVTLKHLISLVNDKTIDGIGAEKILSDFELLAEQNDENKDLLEFFKNDYHKNFWAEFYSRWLKDASILRDYLETMFNRVEVFDLLCPNQGSKVVDLEEVLKLGDKVSFSLNTGRGKDFNSFVAKLILQRIEKVIYLRDGDEKTRSYGNLYLLNEYLYNNIEGFEDYKKRTSYRIDTFSAFQPVY